MSRIHYIGLIRRKHSRSALALLSGSLLLPACSMSVPMPGDDGPASTGSIAAPVDIQKPLPQTLAYSDATKIGQTAALWQVDNGLGGEWVNAATGSSGTIEESASDEKGQEAGGCRGFATLVTSIGGVHTYSGKVCRRDNGRSVVEIDKPGDSRRS